MKTLSGNSFPDDHVFLVKPVKIGALQHAFTNLKTKHRHSTRGSRIVVRLGAMCAGLLAGYLVALACGGEMTALLIASGLCGLIGLGIGWSYTPSSFVHVFLGEKGIEEYFIEADTMEPWLNRRMLFSDASYVVRSLTEHYRNGAYQNTSYTYEWSDQLGRALFGGEGSYHKRTPVHKIEKAASYRGGAQYHFLTLVERAWTNHLLETTLKQLATNGAHEVEFRLIDRGRRNGTIVLSPGRVTVDLEGGAITFRAEELKQLALNEGMLYITDLEYKWKLFGRQGNRLQIPLSSISNSTFFLLLAREWLNTSW